MMDKVSSELADARFGMRECVDADGVVRLSLEGELDIAVTGSVAARLAELRVAATPTRLDVSLLSFIDSTGFQCLYDAVRSAGEARWRLEVCDELMPQVRRVIELVRGDELLWPGRGQSAG